MAGAKRKPVNVVPLSKLTVENLLNLVICHSVIYADICEQLCRRIAGPTFKDCERIVTNDRKIREVVAELKARLGQKAKRRQHRGPRFLSKRK